MKWTRITVNPDQMGGVPCLRGLRIPVATVVGMVAEDLTHEQILQAYPDLEAADIREGLAYAAEAVRQKDGRRSMNSEPNLVVARHSDGGEIQNGRT
jgi:uncharacterized protein (DUF433 family)